MTTHIYAFGSVCRGEIDMGSDIDLLAIVDEVDSRFNPSDYSIYSHLRIEELWKQGNPFAWHLSLEAKLIFSSDKKDFMSELGLPSPYINGLNDCDKFYKIFLDACNSLKESNLCETFDLSSIFLSIRNFATCYSLEFCNQPNFSRHSSQRLNQDNLSISDAEYRVFERARILCTRGIGEELTSDELSLAKKSINKIHTWMLKLTEKIEMKNL